MQVARHVSRHDQASSLRELAPRRARRGRLIAVTSGKGGVGKSSIAANLSVHLAQCGHRVLLADMDLGLANADVLLNVQPAYTLADVLSGVRCIEEILVECVEGMWLLPGASGVEALANLSEFEHRNLLLQLHQAAHNIDIGILDCGAGISRSVTSMALAADQVMVVTTPQATALTDAYATIKLLVRLQPDVRIGVVVNACESKREADRVWQRLHSVARRFLNYSVASHGYMLQDSSVELAVRRRRPFVLGNPESNASACIRAIAESLTESSLSMRRRGGLLSRVVAMLA